MLQKPTSISLWSSWLVSLANSTSLVESVQSQVLSPFSVSKERRDQSYTKRVKMTRKLTQKDPKFGNNHTRQLVVRLSKLILLHEFATDTWIAKWVRSRGILMVTSEIHYTVSAVNLLWKNGLSALSKSVQSGRCTDALVCQKRRLGLRPLPKQTKSVCSPDY